MRHVVRPNDWTVLLTTLNSLAAASSRLPGGEQSAVRTAESWVERISKERWTAQKGIAIASAVVGVGAILYGARTLVSHRKSDGLNL